MQHGDYIRARGRHLRRSSRAGTMAPFDRPHPPGEVSMQSRKRRLCLYVVITTVGLAFGMPAIAADVIAVDEAWVRPPAPGQSVAGAYMSLTSRSRVSVVAAESPDARRVELHTMSMRDGVMRM